MSWIEDREFEPVVREAMQARPQPHSISNLAYRAMEMAREHARALARRQLEGFLRLRRRRLWIGAVAAMLIALIIAVGVRNLPTSTGLDDSISTSTDGSSSDSIFSSSFGSPSFAILLDAELIVVAMILLSADAGSPRLAGSRQE